jgi:hypothetical protein
MMKSYAIKKLLAACLFLAPACMFTACNELILRGKGDAVTQTRPVADFDAVHAGGEFEIFLSQGPTQDIRLEGQENILAELSTQVNHNKLEIKYTRSRVKARKPVRIYLTTPALREVSLSGANTLQGLTPWQVDALELHASGSGNIDMTVTGAQHLASHTSGSARITLSGHADRYEMELSGSGKISAFGLTTKTAEVAVSGSGNCELVVTEQLKTRISGSGKVRYKGNPAVSTNISGSGSVIRVEG